MSKATTERDRAIKRSAHLWAQEVQNRSGISTNTQRFALMIASKFLDRGTLDVIWQNQTMAQKMNVNVRTIQRCIAELKSLGMLTQVKRPGVRRTLRIVPILQDKHDNEHDRFPDPNMSKGARKHDRNVAAYIETQNKSQMAVRTARASYQLFSAADTGIWDTWRVWLCDNTAGDPDMLLELLAVNGNRAFPCRYPEDQETAKNDYIAFFDLVRASDGRCL